MKYSIGDLVEITKNIFGKGERWQSPVGKLGTIVNIESEEERYEDDNDFDCIECNNYYSVDTSLFNNTRMIFNILLYTQIFEEFFLYDQEDVHPHKITGQKHDQDTLLLPHNLHIVIKLVFVG